MSADVGTSTSQSAMSAIAQTPSVTSVKKSEKPGDPRQQLSPGLLQELRSIQNMKWKFSYSRHQNDRPVIVSELDIREDRQETLQVPPEWKDMADPDFRVFLDAAKDEAKQSKPPSKEVIENLLDKKSLNDFQLFEALRFRGKQEQTNEPIWELLMEVVKDHITNIGTEGGSSTSPALLRKSTLEKLHSHIWGKTMSDSSTFNWQTIGKGVNPFRRGPMGDLPFHNCFLLAYNVPEGPHRKLMLEMGALLIDYFHLKVDKDEEKGLVFQGAKIDKRADGGKYVTDSEMYGVSAPYTSDIDKWKGVETRARQLRSLQRILWPDEKENPKTNETLKLKGGGGEDAQQEVPLGMWHKIKTFYQRTVGLYVDPVNDGGLYTGETVLHIAIANQDYDTAKDLVDKYDADITARATGSFFKPTIVRKVEQPSGATQQPTSEQVEGQPSEGGDVSDKRGGKGGFWGRFFRERGPKLSIVANKEGAFEDGDSYFGETPLSFAVVFGNVAIMSLLVDTCRGREFEKVQNVERERVEKEFRDKGIKAEEEECKKAVAEAMEKCKDKCQEAAGEAMVKFVNLQDQFGNTPMHIAVLHQRKAAFDLLAENKADVTITNHQGLTPFTLAARLGFTSMFEHILTKQYQEPVWSYGGVKLVKTDLTQVDSFKMKKLCTCKHIKDKQGKVVGWEREKCEVEEHKKCKCLQDKEKCEVTTHDNVCKCFKVGEDGKKISTGPAPWLPNAQCEVDFHREQAKCKCKPDEEDGSLKQGGGRGTEGRQCGYEGHNARKLHSGGWKGALEIVVKHEVEAFADQELIRSMIRDKWVSYGRSRYFWFHLIPYLMFMIVFTTMVTIRCWEARRDWDADIAEGKVQTNDIETRFHAWELGILPPYPSPPPTMVDAGGWMEGMWLTFLSSTLELCVTLVCAVILFFDGYRHRRLSSTDLDPQQRGWANMGFINYGRFVHKNLTFALCFFTMALLLLSQFCRMIGREREELSLLAVSCIFVFCGLLQRLMPFEFFGRLVIMIWRIFLHDVLLALFIYVILLSAFSLSMFVMWQRSDFPAEMLSRGGAPLDADPSHTFLELIWVSLGEVDISSVLMATHNSSLAFTFHIIWIVLSDVLVLNLLIAMMGRTYEADTRDGHKLWFFPHAAEVLWLENQMSGKDKARFRTGRPANNDNDLLEMHQTCASVFWWFDFVQILAGDQGNHKHVQATAGPHWSDRSTSEQEKDNDDRVQHARLMTDFLKKLESQVAELDGKIPKDIQEQVANTRAQTFDHLKRSQHDILETMKPVTEQLNRVEKHVHGMREVTNKLKMQVRGALGLKVSDSNNHHHP
mmetsp:Transcript_34365/g.83640  ORF Transcript_34365/g.83640 Transcript_34365/m.83640 type:complete len:1321 (-) Transcript_34365:622-4584(-)